MLTLGRGIDAGVHPNIHWINASAENVELREPLDLIIAGASIHWMNPARVFPKLAGVLTPDGTMAIVVGDGPAEAPWIDAWRTTMADWVDRLGGSWNDAALPKSHDSSRAVVRAGRPRDF